MKYDYIIAGQGIAGTMMAWHLEKYGCKVLVVDSQLGVTASNVASGIMNPVTGRRLVKSWLAEEVFPYAHQIYPELEEFLNTSLYRSFDIFKVFGNEKTRKDWLNKAGDPQMSPYLSPEQPTFLDDKQFINPDGSLRIRHAGRVDMKKLILLYRNYLIKQKRFVSAQIDSRDVELFNSHVKWKQFQAKGMVVCTGHFMENISWFKNLPLRPSKGEVMYFKADLPQDRIVNKGVHILPLGNGIFKAGATNSWDYDSMHPSKEGREELMDKIRRLVNTPVTVIGHKAGIRPSTFDRRPLAGIHHQHPRLSVLTGLGAKGTTLAPWFAAKLCQLLLHNQPLPSDASIQRVKEFT